MWPETPDPLIGHTLADRYRLEAPIGSGGMGTVYRAEHVLIKKPVAIKVLSAAHSGSRKEVERFLNEARAASRIRHEHVVDITDFGITEDGMVFLVMEYLEGEDLAATSDREGRLPWRRAAAIVLQIAAALEAAHAQGVVHRDMKPENCFRIRRGDDPDFIKVLDFGIAKVLDDGDVERPSSAGSGLLGTPEYVAPELIQGLKPDARVDIYAVGVMFYDLIVGAPPFAGESFMSTLTAHLTQPPRPPSEVVPTAAIPRAIDAVVLRALAKDRDLRYPTIAEFAADLRAAIAAVDAPPPPAPASSRGIYPRLVLGLVAALLLVFSAVLLYVFKGAGMDGHVTAGPSEADAATGALASASLPAARPAEVNLPAAPEAEAEAPPAAEAVEAVEDAAETDEEAADEGLTAGETEEVEAAEAPARGRGAAGDKRPRRTAQEFAAAMAKVAPRVKLECSRYALRKMEVTVQVVVAADGAVRRAEPVGSQAGSSLGNCVARVAQTARLRPARARSTHRHTFTM
jgi:tRNA A-37 threonylcarbamoyl transferase component Bud32